MLAKSIWMKAFIIVNTMFEELKKRTSDLVTLVHFRLFTGNGDIYNSMSARTLHKQIYLEVIPWIMYNIYVIRWPGSDDGVCAFYRLPSKFNSKWRYCNQNGNGTTTTTIVYVIHTMYVYIIRVSSAALAQMPKLFISVPLSLQLSHRKRKHIL